LLLLLAVLPAHLARAADRPYAVADLSSPAPSEDRLSTADVGLGYGGGTGDMYHSSEAGPSLHLGVGIPTSNTRQFHLLGYIQKIGHTGNAPSIRTYGLDFLFGTIRRTPANGRSQTFFEGGLGFAGNVGYKNSSDVVFTLRGGTLVPLGKNMALELGFSVRPSIFVLVNMLGGEEPTGVLLGLDVGLVF
jgi:hypothetical protein